MTHRFYTPKNDPKNGSPKTDIQHSSKSRQNTCFPEHKIKNHQKHSKTGQKMIKKWSKNTKK
jgi:hypothetical protein